MPNVESITCLVCGADVDIDSMTGIDDIITCNECEAELRVVDLDPLTVEVENSFGSTDDEEIATVP